RRSSHLTVLMLRTFRPSHFTPSVFALLSHRESRLSHLTMLMLLPFWQSHFTPSVFELLSLRESRTSRETHLAHLYRQPGVIQRLWKAFQQGRKKREPAPSIAFSTPVLTSTTRCV